MIVRVDNGPPRRAPRQARIPRKAPAAILNGPAQRAERAGLGPASIRRREAAYETLVVGRCDGCRARRGIARRGRPLVVGHGLRGHEIPWIADAGAAAAGE